MPPSRRMFRAATPIFAAVAVLAALSACARAPATPQPTASPAAAHAPTATAGSTPAAATPTAAAAPTPTPTTPARPSPARPSPTTAATPTPPATQAVTPTAATPTPAAAATVAPVESPTAVVQSEWIKARIAALEAIWQPSQAGRAWMHSYDLRQMIGQPAWFGSTGFDGYAGIGQTIPRTTIHELSHSIWGAFPIEGIAGDPGERDAEGTLKVVIEYHRLLEEFMRQPPDRFEPLRDRFRNMPNLYKGDYSDLEHFGEADMIYMTGGDIDLVPPVLRRFVDAFYGEKGLGGEDFVDWQSTIRWWHGLSDSERQIAGEVFGLQHFPLDKYSALRPEGSRPLTTALKETLAGEERQRLVDFAEQLETVKEREGAVTDAAGVNRGFDFWRGYLNEIRDLHARHPQVLREHRVEQARQIGRAFDFYIEIQPLSPGEQAQRYRGRQADPYVEDFPFLLKARALVELFSGDRPQAGAGEEIGRIVAGYARQLADYARVADSVIAAARRSPEEGGARLEEFLNGLSDDDVRSSLGTVIDLLRESDPASTRDAMRNLSVPAILRLLELRPEIARSGEILVDQLLATVGVTDSASREALIAGVKRLVDHSSGNFAIDRPYDEAVYALLDRKALLDPGLVRDVFRESGLALLPWIEGHASRAAFVFKRDPGAAAKLIIDVADLRTPAPMLLHALVAADADMAAQVIAEADTEPDLVARTFNQFAYDVYWSDLKAGPKVDLAADAKFLSRTVALKGANWTLPRIARGVALYRAAIDRGELEAEFLTRHGDLLRRLLEMLPSDDPAAGMLRLIVSSLPGASGR
ncbi:MAG: hypothetical protein HY682_04445 [Chloroflexi bacterium]|nr:hypothetical protein [Chloroflexota bacterium]